MNAEAHSAQTEAFRFVNELAKELPQVESSCQPFRMSPPECAAHSMTIG